MLQISKNQKGALQTLKNQKGMLQILLSIFSVYIRMEVEVGIKTEKTTIVRKILMTKVKLIRVERERR